MSGWVVEHARGSAAGFHARDLPDPVVRAVHVWEVERPALVLGSAQGAEIADVAACAAAGVEVVRRRSGGGAVLLEPGSAVWVDVELPRGDELWDDDVGRAAWWVGATWGAALADLGVADPIVHHGGLVTTRWSPVVCFAGLGPGEVTAGPAGPKVLGISQRRTRGGARFQCAVPLRWEPGRLAGLLALGPDERAALAVDLAGAVASVPVGAPEVASIFVAALP